MKSQVMISLLLVSLLIACSEDAKQTSTSKNTQESLAAIGELESKTEATIAPPSVSRMWQYQVKTIVPENSKVKEGQVVVSFDDKKISERLVDKQGKMNQAQKELENKILKEQEDEQQLILSLAEAQMNYEKAERKAEIVDESQSEIDRRKAEIDFTIAQADLKVAKLKLEFHRSNTELNVKRLKGKVARLQGEVNVLMKEKEQLKVKAPISGVVLYRANWDGEKPAVGESIQFGQPVMDLAVIEEMQVKIQITEPDSGKVKIGQSINIFLDSAKDTVFKGTLVSLGQVFRDRSHQDKTRVIDAIVELEKIDLEVMRPGMTARVEINQQANSALSTQQAIASANTKEGN